jgi:hypothetical protein
MRIRTKAAAAALIGALAGGSTLGFAAAASAAGSPPKPTVVKITVTPKSLPAAGGHDVVSAQVTQATKVLFDIREVSPVIKGHNYLTSATKAGAAKISFILPPNTVAKPVIWQVTAVAEGSKSKSFAKETTIIVAAAKVAPLPPPTK